MLTKLDSTTFEPQAAVRADPPRPAFDPATQVSADARYIVKQLVLWFLALPLVLAFGVWAIYNATH
jgi:hypothetical protein